MSEISYVCPSCRTEVTVSEKAGGKTLPCPQCGQRTVVPRAAGNGPCLLFQEADPEPIIRLSQSRLRIVRHPLSGPVWGIFLILLFPAVVMIGIAGLMLFGSFARPVRPVPAIEELDGIATDLQTGWLPPEVVLEECRREMKEIERLWPQEKRLPELRSLLEDAERQLRLLHRTNLSAKESRRQEGQVNTYLNKLHRRLADLWLKRTAQGRAKAEKAARQPLLLEKERWDDPVKAKEAARKVLTTELNPEDVR